MKHKKVLTSKYWPGWGVLTIGIVATSFLVDFGGYGYGRVDWVGDDAKHGCGAIPGQGKYTVVKLSLQTTEKLC